MKDYSKEELESLTTIYDKFGPSIALKAKQPRTFNEIREAFSSILEKNREKLQTNIIGRQVTISIKDETRFLDILDINHNDMENAIKESPYFSKFGELKLMAQLAFALPLIILSAEYTKLGKIDEAKVCYMITFFKPYASRESLFFGKYGVNEDQMMYTMENMSERFDIKKLGTIFECLLKMSTASYENYIKGISKTKKLTDRELHVIYASGVSSRVNNFFNPIIELYKSNAGKYLAFEDNSSQYEDDDGADIVDRDIRSDSALRTMAITRALTKLNKDPIDTQLLKISCAKSLNSVSPSTLNVLRDVVNEVSNNMAGKMDEFFSAIINSFLFTMNPKTGKKYSMTDFRTAVFLSVMNKKVYASPNTDDANILKVRAMLDEMLENYCDEYLVAKGTKKRNIRNALFFYWILLIQRAGR